MSTPDNVILCIKLPNPLTSKPLSLEELHRRITEGMKLAREHGHATQVVGMVVYWALQTFIRDYWRQLLPGINRAVKDGETFESLAPIDLENMEYLVLLIELLAAKKDKHTSYLQGVAYRLKDMFQTFGSDRNTHRIVWVIHQAAQARVVLCARHQLSLSERHPTAQMVRQEWCSTRQKIEKLAQDVTDGDLAKSGDGQKRTADEITDEELKHAVHGLFELHEGQAYSSDHLESELTRALRLRGRKESTRLKLRAITLGYIHKMSREQPFYTRGPSLAA